MSCARRNVVATVFVRVCYAQPGLAVRALRSSSRANVEREGERENRGSEWRSNARRASLRCKLCALIRVTAYLLYTTYLRSAPFSSSRFSVFFSRPLHASSSRSSCSSCSSWAGAAATRLPTRISLARRRGAGIKVARAKSAAASRARSRRSAGIESLSRPAVSRRRRDVVTRAAHSEYSTAPHPRGREETESVPWLFVSRVVRPNLVLRHAVTTTIGSVPRSYLR